MPKRKPSQRRQSEKTPQQPRDRLAEIRAEIQDVQQQIETKRRDGRVIRTAEDFKSLERAIAALTNRLSALLMAEATQVALDDSENRRQARSLAQGAGHTIKDQGRRDVTLRTTCGQVIVRATYFSRNCDRSKASKGMYPMLLLWGVHDRCTAAIVSEISKLVAMLSSLEEVEQVLSDRGRPLDYKTIRTIAYRFATRARAAQRVGALNWGETVAGRRVVVSTDGGRIRIRTTKRGPKTAKGRNRYRTDWREPKLLIIYVVDEKGQMDREFLAVIDGTLGGPDAIFKLMEFYLRELKISHSGQDPVRRRWSPLDLEPSRGAAAAVGGQTGPGQRVGGLLSCGGASGQDRGLAAPLDGGGASGVDRSPAATPAERRSRGGASGDRCRVWFSPRQGVETGARILQTERRKRSDGLRTDSSVEVADRQWCDRECDSPCREPAVEGAEHLLAQDDCGGRSAVTFVLQGGTLESS